MDLTAERRAFIDGLDCEQLLRRWRFAPVGDDWFQGETGEYWRERLAYCRAQTPILFVEASKRIGWGRVD